MNRKQTLALSVIILAYNEENQIAACLDSLAVQEVMPDEVIVVNNNSTDNTVAIAESYPFVRVVHETEQGMIPARNQGMSEATGDILARIDADVRVMPNWTKLLRQDFADAEVMAVTGSGQTLALPNSRFYTTFWSWMYLLWMRMYFNTTILWGSNMAIRREVWHKILPELQMDGQLVHEDQDISCLLAGHGYKALTDSELIVTSESQDKAEWPKYKEYVQRAAKTRRLHIYNGNLSRGIRLYNFPQRLGYLLGIFIPVKSIFLICGVLPCSLLFYGRQLKAITLSFLEAETEST